MTRLLLCLAAVGVVASRPLPAVAGPVVYPDFAAWNAAVSGVSTAVLPPPSGSSDFLGTGDVSVSYAGVNFLTNSAIGTRNVYLISGSPITFSAQANNTGLANILITFPVEVRGFAFRYGSFFGDDFNFALSNGDSASLPSGGGSYSLPRFVGITSDTSFQSVLVTTSDNGIVLGDVSYALSLSSVPEPSALSLAAVGLVSVGVGGLLRQRRRQAG